MKKGLNTQLPLHKMLEGVWNNRETRKVILSMKAVYKIAQKNEMPNRLPIDTDTVDMLRARYEKLNIDQLLLLWFENFHSIDILSKRKKVDENLVIFLVSNKMVAIGCIIYDEHTNNHLDS